MDNISGLDPNSRYAAAKLHENAIKERLKVKNLWIRDATEYEDTALKIDGYLIIEGQEESVQIKQRLSGPDILYEVYKDTSEEVPNGRDFTGTAIWYACADPRCNVTLVETSELKEIVELFLKKHSRSIQYPINFMGVQFRNTRDPYSGKWKLLAFFPRKKFGIQI